MKHIELINNIALILALGVIYSFLYRFFDSRSLKYKFFSGILFGCIAVVGMKVPMHLMPGVIFDGRTIILSIAGLFGGPVAVLVAAPIAALYRLYLGGNGAIMGVATIIAASSVGIVYHYLRRRGYPVTKKRYLFLFGIIVHLLMLAMTFLLPPDIRFNVLKNMAIPVMLIYPVATIIVCKLLLDQEDQIITLRELRTSEERYRAIVEDLPVMMFRFLAKTGEITFVNREYRDYFGIADEEIVGKSLFVVVAPEDARQIREGLSAISEKRPIVAFEHRSFTPHGRRWQLWSNQGIFDKKGEIIEYQSVGIDITEKKEAEDIKQQSLEEKEILLKEIHHRVKNNMQIISSLLSLQSRYIHDDRDRDLFVISRNRVRAMAMVHDKLYRSENLASINFGEYISNLVSEIGDSYVDIAKEVKVDVRSESITLTVDHAIPAALIVNELLSNAMKYAFPDGRSGTVMIEFYSEGEGRRVLSVSDNGIGLPPDMDINKTETLGLQLVTSLVRQLRGEIELVRDPGTRFIIRF